MGLIASFYLVLRAAVVSRDALVTENLALQHQLLTLQRAGKRPQLRPFDRLFWVWLFGFCFNWRSVCKLCRPDTVIKWHPSPRTSRIKANICCACEDLSFSAHSLSECGPHSLLSSEKVIRKRCQEPFCS